MFFGKILNTRESKFRKTQHKTKFSTYDLFHPNVTVVMNDTTPHPIENRNSEVIRFHSSSLSAYMCVFAAGKKKEGIYFIRQMQRLFDDFHEVE